MKVFIFCPIGGRTGGPEAIHQFCDKLRKNGVNSFLIPSATYGPRVEQYEIYDAPLASIVDVTNDDIIVTPESFLRLPRELENHPNSRIFIWWLSVNNANHKLVRNYLSVSQVPPNSSWKEFSFKSNIRKVKLFIKSYILRIRDLYRTRHFIQNSFHLDFNQVGHLAQSAYAGDFIKKMINKDFLMVSDYVQPHKHNEEHLETQKNVVVFNFAKGGELVAKVEALIPEIKFVPLRKMTNFEVTRNIMTASLYLDLGHFPGKDRLPREAILLGTPVLISNRGSGRYSDDFDLDAKYRIDMNENNPSFCADMVRTLVKERQTILFDQQRFRDQVLAQESIFVNEVRTFSEMISR